MRLVRFYNVSPGVGAFFIILSLGLAACVPLQPPAPQAAAPTSASNPIPVTGGGATPAPTFTPTVAANTPTPTQAAPAAPAGATAAAQVKLLVLKTAKNKKLGTFLVDAQGMTLYFNKQDTPGVSTCTGACAATWLPVLVSGSTPTAGKGVKASLVGMFTRPDGTQQATYKGLPLYYFSGDQKPGDVKGQGIGGQWSVVVLVKPVHKTSHSSGGGSNNSTNSGGSNGGNNGGSGGSGGGGGGGMMGGGY